MSDPVCNALAITHFTVGVMFKPISTSDKAFSSVRYFSSVMLSNCTARRYLPSLVNVEVDDFRFSELMKNGHIALTSTKAVHVAPQTKQSVLYMSFLRHGAPANVLSDRVQDWISGTDNDKMSTDRIR